MEFVFVRLSTGSQIIVSTTLNDGCVRPIQEVKVNLSV